MAPYELISRESIILAGLYGEKIEFIVNLIKSEIHIALARHTRPETGDIATGGEMVDTIKVPVALLVPSRVV